MSMQNLTASANLQLFSKALQESAQQANDPHDQQQQHPAISAADFQHFMLSQLDQHSPIQQLYLSQLNNGFGGSSADGASGNNNGSATAGLFSLGQQQPASSGSSDSATTTVSNCSQGQGSANDHRPPTGEPQQPTATNKSAEFASSSSSAGSATDECLAQRAQFMQQKLMEQFLEAAANGGGALDPQQQQNGGAGQQDEFSQLMAQLIGANGGGGTELQQMAQQLAAGQQQQQRGESPPISMLDQLQLLQMLGAAGGPNLADLIAGTNVSSSFPPTSMAGYDGGVGQQRSMPGGGSPNKDDTYCEICNKNVCNRYFLKIHLAKKHGIGTAGSPLKSGNGNFSFGSGGNNGFSMDSSAEFPGRAHSVSMARDSPSGHHQHRLSSSQKQSMSSTPGLGGPGGNANSNSALNDSLSAADQQLMGQAIMQQIAAQLELAAQSGNPADRPALIEQLLSAGLPLAELLQQQQQSTGQQQQQDRANSPAELLGGGLCCPQCSKHFQSQSALFQHQLSEHIGAQEPSQNNNEQLNPLAMRWAMDAGGGGGGANGLQQQQLLGQLLGSAAAGTFPGGNAHQMLMSPFGQQQMNQADLDGAAMLAKLSAELAAVSQAQQQSGGPPQQQQGLHHLQQQQNGGGGQPPVSGHTPLMQPSMKVSSASSAPQKRQYSSTSKNYCDLCNKEVCNKYFLRTHMLKMHNIVIDENKVVIANIDTTEKERKGEVKFRCEICLTSLANRDQLRTHKRDVHGMQPPLANSLVTPPSSKHHGLPLLAKGGGGAMETPAEGRLMGLQQQTTPHQFLPFGELHAATERQPTTNKAMLEGGGPPLDENGQPLAERASQADTSDSALPPSVKQLLSQLIGDPLLAPAGRMDVKRESTDHEHHQHQLLAQQQHQNDFQRRMSGIGADANNNASCCRFCGLCLESEEHLQLHQLMDHLELVRPEQQAEDKLVNQVAMQMAKANSQKAHRKSSAASSGASSSSSASAASSSGGAGVQAVQPPPPQHPCPQCKRTYKSVQKMEQHQRTVHHQFVAKLSPSKMTVISPKKISKLVNSFSCMKCQRRFGTKLECNQHVINAHLRPREGTSSPRVKRARREEEDEAAADEMEEQDQHHQTLLANWVREEEASSDPGRLMVDEGEGEEEAEEKEHEEEEEECPGGDEATKHRGQAHQKPGERKEGEKHSHTSGSTSPVSVHASSSSGHHPPEGFAHPCSEHQKPFVLQSFTVRPVPGEEGSGLPEELVAYLPVRTTLSRPLRVTLELQPNPQLDSEVRHL